MGLLKWQWGLMVTEQEGLQCLSEAAQLNSDLRGSHKTGVAPRAKIFQLGATNSMVAL